MIRIIDSVFESTNCLIAGKRALAPGPRELAERVIAAFRRAAADGSM